MLSRDAQPRPDTLVIEGVATAKHRDGPVESGVVDPCRHALCIIEHRDERVGSRGTWEFIVCRDSQRLGEMLSGLLDPP